MLNIIIYDWMKRWKFFAAGITLFLIVNIDLVYRIIHQSNPNFISAAFIMVLFIMAAALFFDHIGRMYRSLFKEEGQLMFSLPISGYRFLGGKILAVIIESLAVSLLVACVLYIDYKILIDLLPVKSITTNIQLISFINSIEILVLIFLSYIAFLSMVYLSMVLAKSVFSSNKYGGLLSFLCFLLISKIFSMFSNAFSYAADYYPEHMSMADVGISTVMITIFIIMMFVCTGYLLDRRINL